MANKRLTKIFNLDNFIYLSLFNMVLNSIGVIRVNPKSQYLSMILAAFLAITIAIEFINNRFKIELRDYTFQIMILIASLLSLVFNSKAFIAKNVYSFVSIFSNFFIFYSLTKHEDYKQKFYRPLKILTYTLLFINLLNLFLLTFNIQITIGELQYMGIDKLRGRFVGISANANGLARVALSGIISSMLYYIYSYKKSITFLSLNMVIHVYVVLMSQSRGTIIAMFLGLVTMMALAWLNLDKLNKGFKLSLLILTFVIGSYGSLKTYIPISSFLVDHYYIYDYEQEGGLQERDEKEADRLEADISNGRMTLMKNGIKLTYMNNKFFGLSYGGNKIQIQKYLDDYQIEVPEYIYDGAGSMHNTFVQFFVNLGFIGLIPFVLLFMRYVFIWLKTVFFSNDLHVTDELILMGFIAVSLFVLNMVEWVFYFDLDNHLVNFFQMYVMGWTYFRLNKKKEDKQI